MIQKELADFKDLLAEHSPRLVFSFGAFAYEFGRRASGESMPRSFGYWGSVLLGKEFARRIAAFDPSRPNLIPLLHRSIAGGKFLKSHENFTGRTAGNYFQYVGEEIAKLVLGRDADFPDIWVAGPVISVSMGSNTVQQQVTIDGGA